MANSYTLTMTDISLTSISIQLGSEASVALTDAMIKIRKLNVDTFADFTDFTVDAGATTTVATINPDDGHDFAEDDLILIQIVDGANYSDRVMVDFSQDYDGTHTATYKYEVPNQQGSYEMELDKVNGVDFSAVKTDVFKVGYAPNTVGSSITMNKNYLVKYSGEVIEFTVVLDNDDAQKPVAQGNYEVSMDAKSL
jgi:hypothetical protein